MVNNVEMNAEQLLSEIKSNSDAYIKIVKVNDIEYLFFAINEIPLAMMGKDNFWKDIGYKDLAPQRMSIGSSFAIWTGDYDDDPRYKRIFAQNFNLAATDGSLSEYDLLQKIPNDAELTPQQAIGLAPRHASAGLSAYEARPVLFTAAALRSGKAVELAGFCTDDGASECGDANR